MAGGNRATPVPLIYAIAAITSVAIICTTVVGVLVDGPTAAAVLAGIAAVATPVIMGLLNQFASAGRTQELSHKLDVQTETMREEVHNAKEEVKAKVTETVVVPPVVVPVVLPPIPPNKE